MAGQPMRSGTGTSWRGPQSMDSMASGQSWPTQIPIECTLTRLPDTPTIYCTRVKVIALETARMTIMIKFAWLPQHWQALAMKAVHVAVATARHAGMQTLEERPFANNMPVGPARTVAMNGLLMTIARSLVEHALQIQTARHLHHQVSNTHICFTSRYSTVLKHLQSHFS